MSDETCKHGLSLKNDCEECAELTRLKERAALLEASLRRVCRDSCHDPQSRVVPPGCLCRWCEAHRLLARIVTEDAAERTAGSVCTVTPEKDDEHGA